MLDLTMRDLNARPVLLTVTPSGVPLCRAGAFDPPARGGRCSGKGGWGSDRREGASEGLVPEGDAGRTGKVVRVCDALPSLRTGCSVCRTRVLSVRGELVGAVNMGPFLQRSLETRAGPGPWGPGTVLCGGECPVCLGVLSLCPLGALCLRCDKKTVSNHC